MTRQSMRLLMRLYLFEGAPHGPTVSGLFQYWCERSISWRSAGSNETPASLEAGLIRRFQSEGLCAGDGSLHHAPMQ
jgi:hypothetical protein